MLAADSIVQTTCPYCGVGCQIDLHIKDSQIYRVQGRDDSVVNQGSLCVKGRFGYDFVHDSGRLTEPLLRSDRTQPFSTVSWDHALGSVADRLRSTVEQYGPDSVAFLTSAKCTNEENYLLQKLARAVVGTNNIDHCARL